MNTLTATASAATTSLMSEPVKFLKQIGSTDYIINVRFNPNATETIEDKILRMIESEVRKSA